MHKNTSKQNSVASEVNILQSPDMKKRKLTNIHHSSNFSNTAVYDFIKLSKQNTHQYTDLIKLGEIYFSTNFLDLTFIYYFKVNKTKKKLNIINKFYSLVS